MGQSGADSSVHFLLSEVDPDLAAAVARRIDLPPDEPARHPRSWYVPGLRSSFLWQLENDDPQTNREVAHTFPDDALRRRVRAGAPFGRATGPLPVVDCCRNCEPAPLPPGAETTEGVIALLRAVTSMAQGNRAADALAWDGWDAVVAADRAEPLPGYAKWGLANRIDCPHEVRLGLATHRKHLTRLRRAGLVRDAGEYATEFPHAFRVLKALNDGRWAVPHRAAEAAAALGPLVRAELGGDLEAWSVLAQLLPTFAGALPELLRTCGAITRV